ncbi:MAG TPA: hypothetical protein VMW49_07375 [Candidatus Dormibacteraeota bacterium]|nr:hypothetical protein [Candidatus Dormibacteraeota bacterium]
MADCTATRHDDGSVTLALGDRQERFSKDGWCQLVADVSARPSDESAAVGAALVHEGRFSVTVTLDQEAIGRVVLRRASGLALPAPSQVVAPPSPLPRHLRRKLQVAR